MPRRARLRLGTPAFVVAALVMLGAAVLEAGMEEVAQVGLAWLGALTCGLAMLAARWSPVGGLGLLLASVVAMMPFSELPPVGGTQLIALMLLVGLVAYRSGPRTGLAAYLLAAVIPAASIVESGQSAWEFAFFVLILGPAWLVGLLLRREQERSAELERLTEALQHERERQAEVAVAAERTRISRELHDAVAHTVSVMTLQVGVVRRRLGDESVEGQTLRGAETLGRQAVDELRRIVGLVREGEAAALAPLPSLAQLDELVEQVRGTDADVTVTVEGDLATVPQAVDMSAYRIVQEALTNVLRHAPGAPADVTVTVTRDDLRLSVTNAPAMRPLARHGERGGNGLVGMRERVAVLGGTLDAGPSDGGGYAVRAVLPLAGAAPSAPTSPKVVPA
jgi:signal transduction histidine kinase